MTPGPEADIRAQPAREHRDDENSVGSYGDECVQGFRNGSWDTEGCLGGKCESFAGCPAHEVVGLGLPGLNYWYA